MELQTCRQQHNKQHPGMTETAPFTGGKRCYDSRHRSIIAQLDAMIESLLQHPGRKLTTELDKLLDSMMEHIGSENNFMSLVNYPQTTKHRNHHYYLFVMADDLSQRFATSQDVPHEELANMRLLWLAHIQTHDRAFEEFLAF